MEHNNSSDQVLQYGTPSHPLALAAKAIEQAFRESGYTVTPSTDSLTPSHTAPLQATFIPAPRKKTD